MDQGAIARLQNGEQFVQGGDRSRRHGWILTRAFAPGGADAGGLGLIGDQLGDGTPALRSHA